MQALALQLLRTLRVMDDEADTIINGVRMGLSGYYTHVGSKRSEQSWVRGMKQHLFRANIDAEMERPYPGQRRKKCDLVVKLDNGTHCWVEVKPAWRAWFSSSTGVTRNTDSLYRGYLYGPLEPGLERSHSVAQDVDKLEALNRPHADYVALVIIGFDEANGSIKSDVEGLYDLKRMSERGWRIVGPETWTHCNTEQCRHFCWVWWRQAPADGGGSPA